MPQNDAEVPLSLASFAFTRTQPEKEEIHVDASAINTYTHLAPNASGFNSDSDIPSSYLSH